MSIPRKRIKTPSIVATVNRGKSRWLIAILILFVVWTLAVFQFGRSGFGLFTDSSEQGDGSGRQLEQLRSEYKVFKERADELGNADQELGGASDLVAKLRDERTKLVEDMSILGKSSSQELQLKIKDIAISPGDEAGTFAYKVAIEPMKGGDEAATGMLKLLISGATNGNPEVVEVPQKADGLEENRRVFYLSHDLTGFLKLPDKFLPDTVTLELITGNDSANPLKQKYTWSDVLSKTRADKSLAGDKDKLIDDLRKENLALKIKLSRTEVADQGAVDSSDLGDSRVEALQRQRDTMAQEIERLKQQVITLKGAFVIRDISIDSEGDEGEVEFVVTVTRSVNDGERIQGNMTVALAGTEAGEEKTYTLDKLTDGKKTEYTLGFKNYQEIKQPLLLPKGFDPKKVVIHIAAENSEIQEFNQEFDWKQLTE